MRLKPCNVFLEVHNILFWFAFISCQHVIELTWYTCISTDTTLTLYNQCRIYIYILYMNMHYINMLMHMLLVHTLQKQDVFYTCIFKQQIMALIFLFQGKWFCVPPVLLVSQPLWANTLMIRLDSFIMSCFSKIFYHVDCRFIWFQY